MSEGGKTPTEAAAVARLKEAWGGAAATVAHSEQWWVRGVAGPWQLSWRIQRGGG